ncbi:MAG: hypothetical protein JSV89_17995 [Spirochaetaceae bacterium]|nr:MAG: hypothetical protein JSV89_17995 [Spirochaetaceae bacterium]
MNDSAGEILFLRVPPRGLVKPGGGAGRTGLTRLAAVFASNGFCGWVGERRITCFWIGMGRGVRVPGEELLDRMRSGRIVEILDIGCAGALDPSLRRGDLVLGSDDIAFDSGMPMAVRRHPGLQTLMQEGAASRGVSFRRAPILTHERFISSREERVELFERTGCVAVQMEQVWFLQRLQALVSAGSLEKIRITHLVLITDTVPQSSSRLTAAHSAWDALTGYVFPGGKGRIASLRSELLSRWPVL